MMALERVVCNAGCMQFCVD